MTGSKYEPLPDGTCRCHCGGRPVHGGFLRGHHSRTPEGRAKLRVWGPLAHSQSGTLRERLESRLAEPDALGCRTFTGTRNRYGYGMLTDDDGRIVPAHRVAWVLAGNELQEDRDLHHACSNRTCCEVSHLVPLSRSEHALLHWRLRREAEAKAA